MIKPDIHQINRLGFEAWADNVIYNVIQDMKAASKITLHEDYEVTVTRTNGVFTAVVRCHVEGLGWMTHERSYKN